MTGKQLHELRKSRGQTRAEMAAFLVCSPSAIVKWESDENPIPAWVAEKMLRSVQVTLPLEDLAILLEECGRRGIRFENYLTQIIRDQLSEARRTRDLRVAEDPPDEYKPHA